MKAINLTTEYLKNPLGIDITIPRLFWNCENGKIQTSYEINATDHKGTVVWNSGKVHSDRMTHIKYMGKPLQSREIISWKVRVWDEQDVAGEWSDPAVFEMGLLEAHDWKASWITGNYTPSRKQRYPVDYFWQEFAVSGKKIQKVRLYVTACGLYSAYVNGVRVGDAVLAPGYTDYRKRVQYQVYDLTQQVKKGSNQLEFRLADGWYRGSVGAWGHTCYYGKETKLLAQLEITYEDATVSNLYTNKAFQWSNDGPVRFADNKDGEIVEAFRIPSYKGNAKEVRYAVVPTASNNVLIQEHETFTPKMMHTPSGKTVLDFGQNIAGYIKFSVKAKQGQRIFLRFGEMFDEEGEFTQKNIQCHNKRVTTPLQQITYICKDGQNNYKTEFAIFGFQYMLVESDVPLEDISFTAIAVYSHMEQRMKFNSSSDLLNRLTDCTLWSAKNNSADVPTDCPTRERHGWTGDAQIFFNTAGYLMDYAAFARKYIVDLNDWQDRKGRYPQIAPEGGTDFYMKGLNGSVGWSDAGIMIPYRMWKLYGDKQILEDFYPNMKRYAEFMINRCGKRFLFSDKVKVRKPYSKYVVNTGQSYGEWAEPADIHVMKWTDFVKPHPEVSTAYTSYVMTLMQEIAESLGKTEDRKRYGYFAEQTRKAYSEMVKLPEFNLDTNRQAQLVRPLYFGLLDKDQETYARKRLIQALENYNWRLGTGFLSTPLILYVLSAFDKEAAYRLLENEEMPGWFFMPKSGANTIWESWEGTSAQGGIASLDHYSKGACLEWIYGVMCGINITGENTFRIAPVPGGSFTFAEAEYQSIYGTVSCSWHVMGDSIRYKVSIPSNTRAEIVLPGLQPQEVEAGTYEWMTASR